MKEEIEILINDLETENDKLTNQLNDKPDMIWTYKSAKMNTRAVNLTMINKLKEIIN